MGQHVGFGSEIVSTRVKGSKVSGLLQLVEGPVEEAIDLDGGHFRNDPPLLEDALGTIVDGLEAKQAENPKQQQEASAQYQGQAWPKLPLVKRFNLKREQT